MSTIFRNRQFGIIKTLAVLVLSTLTASCAQPARHNLMAAPNLMPEVVGSNPSLQSSVSVIDVTGGKDTNPMWTSQVGSSDFRSALERSLQNSVLLAAIPSDARYVVSAQLLELKQPFIGVSMTVTSRVSYHVTEQGASEVFMNEEVVTPYTASFSSSLYGPERLRLANEGSIRENLSEFVKRFIAKWVMRSKNDLPRSGRPTS